jgi:hypothetical protein
MCFDCFLDVCNDFCRSWFEVFWFVWSPTRSHLRWFGHKCYHCVGFMRFFILT